jgi:hypothetical protein
MSHMQQWGKDQEQQKIDKSDAARFRWLVSTDTGEMVAFLMADAARDKPLQLDEVRSGIDDIMEIHEVVNNSVKERAKR